MSGFGIGKLGLGAAGVTAAVALVAGCSSSGSSSSSVKPAAGGGAGTSGTSLKTMSTSIGTVLVDGSGHTVYELVGDSAAHQTCTGGCLSIWPAVMAKGSQVVVNGHPAFTYYLDSAAGQTKGQNVKDQWGVWLALDAKGNPISAPAAGPSKAPASPAPAATTKAPSGGGGAF